MWQKYKTNLPGENSWADLRWSVREKLLGEKPTKNIKKVSVSKYVMHISIMK